VFIAGATEPVTHYIEYPPKAYEESAQVEVEITQVDLDMEIDHNPEFDESMIIMAQNNSLFSPNNVSFHFDLMQQFN